MHFWDEHWLVIRLKSIKKHFNAKNVKKENKMSQHSNYYIFRSCPESDEIIFREHREAVILEEEGGTDRF